MKPQLKREVNNGTFFPVRECLTLMLKVLSYSL